VLEQCHALQNPHWPRPLFVSNAFRMGHTANPISISNLFDENYANRRMTQIIWQLSHIKACRDRATTRTSIKKETDRFAVTLLSPTAKWQSGTAEHERAFDISLCMSWGTGYSSADWEVLISEFPMLNVCYHTAPPLVPLLKVCLVALIRSQPRSRLLLCVDPYFRRGYLFESPFIYKLYRYCKITRGMKRSAQ
jgi:hypothetical protein